MNNNNNQSEEIVELCKARNTLQFEAIADVLEQNNFPYTYIAGRDYLLVLFLNIQANVVIFRFWYMRRIRKEHWSLSSQY